MHALPYHSQAFLDGLFKVTPYGHHLADRLHRRTEFLVYATELAEVPTRNLADYIVERRLKECACCLGDGVLQLEKSVAHTKFCCHKGKRITGCLGCKSRRTAQTGIHFNDTIVLALGVESILNITLTDNTYMTYNLD